jgi:hypothetical protein
MKATLILFLLIIFGIEPLLKAQDKNRNIKTVTITLPGGFTGASGNGIPFDESFNLSGNATGIERLDLHYRIKPFQGNRTFRFKIQQPESKSFNIMLTGSDKIIKKETDTVGVVITVDSKKLKPTVKDQQSVGIKLIIPKGGNHPFINKIFATDTTINLNFDGYQLIDESGDLSIEADYISPEYYFPSLASIGSDGYTKSPVHWEKNADTFLLNVGPLHANILYDFQFKVYTRPQLSDSERTKLLNELIDIIDREFKVATLNGRNTVNDKELDLQLSAVMGKAFNKGGILVDTDLNPHLLNHSSSAIKGMRDKVLKTEYQQFNRERAIQSIYTDLINQQPGILNTGYYITNIQEEITDIEPIPGANALYTLSGSNLAIWNGNLDESTIPIRNLAKILADKNALVSILKGSNRIDNNGILVSQLPSALDLQSVSYLEGFFKQLNVQDFEATTITDNKTFKLFQTTGFQQMYTVFTQLRQVLAENDTNLAAAIITKMLSPSAGLLSDPSSLIRTKLLPIVTNQPGTISTQTKDLLAMPLNPGIAEYKSIKVSDAALLVYNAYTNPTYFSNLFSGLGVIDGSGKFVEHKQKQEVSLPSIQVLISFFRLINSPAFTDTGNRLIFSDHKTELDMIIFKLEAYAVRMKDLQLDESNMEGFREQISSQISSTFLKKSYFLSGSSIIDMDIKPEKNPYVGVDLGMGYAFGPKAVFLNEGINIYFRPINRNVPLSSFYGMDRFWKTFSVFLGISQVVSDNAGDSGFQTLFNTGSFKSNLVGGVGYRVNSLLRLNTGALIYRKSNSNPVIAGTTVRASPTFSLAIDLSVAKLITSISSIF